MQKYIRCFHRLLPVLAGAALMACNSSGSPPAEDGVEERPTIVSSDAATIRDDPEATVDDPATGDAAPTDTVVDSDGEIRTIDDLLAHLEAKNNDASVEPDAVLAEDPVTDTPDTTPPDTTDASIENDVQDPVVEDTDPSDAPEATPDTDGSDAPTPEPDTNAEGQSPVDETPVAETPVTDTPETDTPETETPGTLEPGAGDTNTDTADDPVTEPATDDESTDPTQGFVASRSEIVVDCEQRLPCTAGNADGAVSVVVENVYRHPETQRLAIALSVTANRDTAVQWDNDITSTDDIANTYNGTSREFSGFYQHDPDNDMVTLLAGTTLLVVQHFRELPLDTTVSLVRFDTGYIEAGVRTALQFSNMPLDPVLGDIVDCNNQVPCSWVSTDQSYSVNVIKASGLWQTGRLRVDFEVRATIGLALNAFSSDPVVGNDGSVFTPRTHSLGGTADYQLFNAPLVAEGVLSGFQDFLVNADRLATSLVQVRLGMTRVNAPGAGSPVFRNLPLE